MHLTLVDYVANATIVSAFRRSVTPLKDVLFFNCTNVDPIFSKEGLNMINKHIYKHVPLKSLVWYPNYQITNSLLWHKISLVLFQLIPALIFDALSLISGSKKP
jgi:hypothetical protein